MLDTAQYPIGVPSNKQTQSASFRFTATAQDNAVTSEVSSGIAKLQYTFDSTKAAANIVDVTGVSSLSETIVFNDDSLDYAFSTEGKKKIYIRAIDDVGNIGEWAEKEFMYDTAEPELKVLSYQRETDADAVSFDANAASLSFDSGYKFSLSGTVNDNNGIETFEIWQKKSGSTYTTGTNTDDQLGKKLTDISVSNAASGSWSVSGLPRKESAITITDVDSGIYTYTIRATDKSAYGSQSAKTTTQTVTVSIDKTAPTVTIDLAESNTQAYGENALKGSAYTFRGTANDTGDGSSGFDTLWYAFTTSAISNPNDYSFTLFVKPSTSNWSIPMNLGTGSTTADTSDTLYEGKKYLYVKGVDRAGNVSTVKSFTFMVDQSDPEVTCYVYKNETSTPALTPVNGIVYLKNEGNSSAEKYTLRGTVSDPNGIKELKVDGESVTPASDGKWSISFSAQGDHTHTIKVSDKSGKDDAAGKSKEITTRVIFDTTVPTATINKFNVTTNGTDPDTKKYWLSGEGKTYISGTAGDVGAGLDTLQIKVGTDASASYDDVTVSESWSYELDLSGLSENDETSYQTVTIKAVDKAGNEKEYPYYFRYDKTPPKAKLELNKNGEFVNETDLSSVKLSGYAYDDQTTGRAVESAIITVKGDLNGESIDSYEYFAEELNVTASPFEYTSTSGNHFGEFTKTGLSVNTYEDGVYLFTLEVKDKANLSPAAGSTLTASMTVDKTSPSISKVRFGELTSTATSLSSNNAKTKISVQFTEKNPEGVYYYINDGSNTTLTGANDAEKAEQVSDADWINMKYTASGTTGTVYTASKDISFSDGKGKVYIKVVDKANNISYDTSLSYEVDTKAPDVCTLGSVSVKNDDNTLTELTGTRLINGTKPIVFTVNASDFNDVTSADDATKVDTIVLKSIGSETITGVSGTAAKTNGNKTGLWTFEIPAAKLPATGGSITVTATDILGNSKDFRALFTLDIDTKAPRLENYSLASSYDAGVNNSTQTFYMNNEKSALKIEGIAKDDRNAVNDGNGEIEKVELTLTGKVGTTDTTKTLTSTEAGYTFEIKNDAVSAGNEWQKWSNWKGNVTATIKATDKAKNVSTEKTFKIIFDTTPPAGLHELDSSGKDIYFRVGDQDNDDITPSSTNPEWSDLLDKDVGGKYKSGTFGNQETIKIRGNFEETGSGIAMIYYQLYTDEDAPTTAKINAFEANPAVKAHGYFSPKETERRVFYNGDVLTGGTALGSTGKYYKSISSTYLTTLSGFQAGHNYLVLVAVDNVGNAAVDTISGNYYTINVDTQAPQTATFADKYIDGKSDLKLTLDVTDNPSGTGSVSAGIKSVTVKMDGVTEVKTATKIAEGKYEVTIPVAQIPASGTYNVSVTAVDAAGKGNSDTRIVGKVIVDKTPPTASLTSTSGFVKAAIANASISVSDTNGLKKNASNKQIVTYNVYASTDTSYATSLANGTVVVGDDSVATVASIATNDQDKFVDGNSYIVRFTAEDIVGNKTYVNTGAYTIDRTGPAIKDAVSGVGGVETQASVAATNQWFNVETLNIFGEFEDAGCGVETINYTLTPYGSTATTGSWSTANGTYSANLAGFNNGTNTLVLEAVDKLGNQSSAKTYTVKVDTSQPEISEKTNNDFKNITLTNGKSAKELEFYVTDSGSGINGAASISVKAGSSKTITNGSNGSSFTVSEVSGQTNKWLVKVTLGATDLNSLTGNNSILVTITDKAGNKSNSQSIGTVNVDKDNPVPSFTSPAANATLNGKISLSGRVTDESNSEITKISLTAESGTGSAKVTKVYEYPAPAASTGKGTITYSNGLWSIAELDTTTFYNGVNSQPLKLSLTATDKADNSNTTAVTLEPTIDQNYDRPIVKFTNLNLKNGEYILTYGTAASMEGTVSDDDATSEKVVTTFIASSTRITSASDTPTGTTTFDHESGAFTFTPASAADGLKNVYFYIKDNEGKEFYTATGTAQNLTPSALNRPYQQYKTSTKESNDGVLSYRSDSKSPTIDSELQIWKNATGTTDDDKNGSPIPLGSSCIVGGVTKKNAAITISANDANGIQGIVIELKQGDTVKRYRSNSSVFAKDEEGNDIPEKDENNNDNYINTGTVISTANEAGEYSAHEYTIPRLLLNDTDDTDNIEADFTQDSLSSVDDIEKGLVHVTVVAYDKSGIYGNQTSQFVIDNTAPVLNINSPATDDEIVYAIQSNTVGGNVEASDVDKIEYTVTTSESAPTAAPSTGWIEVGTTLSATLIFDGDESSTENGKHSKTLREWYKQLKGYTTDTEINASDTRVNMFVHFRVTDKCGNAGWSVRKLSAYPNGDKPSIDLVYPENKTDGSKPSLAGTIRIYGYASVAIGYVKATYVQIDPNFTGSVAADGTITGFNEDWQDALSATEIAEKETYAVEQIGEHDVYGIKANGTQNWNLPINGNSAFNPTGNESRHMAIRIYALSDSGKISEPFIQLFDVDPNAPHIGGDGSGTGDNKKYPIQIVEYTGSPTASGFANFTNAASYQTDMWLKGQKYLIASVYDDSGIKSLTLNENIDGVNKVSLVSNSTASTTATLNSRNGGGSIVVVQKPCGFADKKNFWICIPLPTSSGSGNLEWVLEATEDSGNNNSCTETIRINYDNVAPKIGTKDHSQYNIEPEVQQKNGFYTLKGYASDAEGSDKVSGMMGVAFYFMRRATSNSTSTRVYDPMWKGTNSSVDVRTGSTNATDITYSHGLYWKHKTNIARDENDATKLTLTEEDKNIHTGGLALIGGTIYRIQNVDGATIYVDGEVPDNYKVADFAIALVVDNLTKAETTTGRTINNTAGTYGYGYYSAHDTNDDGDLMIENWEGTTVEGQWEARINSANIPDGPIEIHYVAFDKSQNYAVGIVGNVKVEEDEDATDYWDYETLDVEANSNITGTEDTTNKLATNFYYAYNDDKPAYVSNNAPRIAGVNVWTDYNGNNNYDDSEKRSKYVGQASRYIGGDSTENRVEKPTDVTKIFIASSDGTEAGGAMMTIKAKTKIVPEIVGGNGALYYQYKVNDGDFTQGSAMTPGTDFTRNTSEGQTNDAVGQSYYVTTSLKAIEFTEQQITNSVESNGTAWWTIEIWDSTEETVQFTSSQFARIKLPLDVQTRDTVAPNTVINDLYWNSSTDNSVYRDSNKKLHGHVELRKDLTYKEGNTTKTTTLGTTYGTDDDKISGKVVFRGYAYDNKRLASLKWGIKNALTGTIKEAWPQNYITAAEFTGGVWTATGDASIGLPYYYLKVYDDAAHGAYLDERGHKVYWELTIDTSRVQEPGKTDDEALAVGKDLYVYMQATDTAGEETEMNPDAAAIITDGADAENLRPNYKVDVVPYITGVKTRLSRKNKSNPEVYSRTAQGHYPIASDETEDGDVMLQGYNLTSGSADVDISSIISTQTTGAYAYTRGTGANAVMSINNMNYNDAHGDFDLSDTTLTVATKAQNMYNRTPSTVTNLTLDDDVYFDIWEFKKAASPKSGKINEPVMHINPYNQKIGFAFANGADALSLPNGRGDSYTAWQKNYADYSGINFVYDTNGYVHSVSTGLDTEPNQGYGGYMQYIFSRWGGNGVNNMYNWNADTTSALESVAVPSQTYIGNTQLTANLIDIDRFGTPAIAVATRTNPTVYIAYYDGDSNHIRFRYGSVSNAKSGRVNNFDQLSDDKCASGTVIGHNNRGAEETHAAAIGDDDTTGATTYDQHRGFEAHTDYYSILAGKSNGATQTDTGNGASEFVALDVIPGANANTDVVVIVWYDGSDLMYTYRYGTKDDTDCKSTGVANKWSEPKVIFEGAGQYCTIKVDKNNGIHIAAYNRSGADLYYCYMSGYDKYASRKTALVDSYSQVGKYISLDTALVLREGSTTEYNVVPYITYYGDGFNGLPKLAYLPGGINSASPVVPNGADDDTDLFTGKWEVSIIPTSSEVNEDNMNVALWKTNDGVLTASTKSATGYTEPTITAAGTNSATWYGNGSSELVLGYGITDGATGFIEIGQMKK